MSTILLLMLYFILPVFYSFVLPFLRGFGFTEYAFSLLHVIPSIGILGIFPCIKI